MPARPSRATTSIAGSSSSSRAKRCSFERARRPHASGAVCDSSSNSSPTRRVERRLRTGAEHGELVLADAVAAVDHVGVDRAGGVEAVDDLEAGLDRRPADGGGVGAVPRRAPVLGRVDAEVGRLDAQRGVVRHHRRRAVLGLAERGADDPVVRARRVEAVLDQAVLLDVVDLDPQGCSFRRRPVRRANRRDERAGPRSCGARCRAARPTSSGRFLSPSSSSITVSGTTRSDVLEGADAVGIGDEHRRVEHHPHPCPFPQAGFVFRACAWGSRRNRSQVAGQSPMLLTASRWTDGVRGLRSNIPAVEL